MIQDQLSQGRGVVKAPVNAEDANADSTRQGSTHSSSQGDPCWTLAIRQGSIESRQPESSRYLSLGDTAGTPGEALSGAGQTTHPARSDTYRAPHAEALLAVEL